MAFRFSFLQGRDRKILNFSFRTVSQKKKKKNDCENLFSSTVKKKKKKTDPMRRPTSPVATLDADNLPGGSATTFLDVPLEPLPMAYATLHIAMTASFVSWPKC